MCNLIFVLTFILHQVQETLREFDTKLEHPIESSTSSAEIYKALQNHMVSLVVLLFFFNFIKYHYSADISFSTHNSVKITVFLVQDVVQYVEKLKGNLLSLSASARRLNDKEQAEKTLTELNTSYEQSMEGAKVKQSSLENLFSLWQK